jgi:thymidylate kinase
MITVLYDFMHNETRKRQIFHYTKEELFNKIQADYAEITSQESVKHLQISLSDNVNDVRNNFLIFGDI